jgi:hypothetical protein
MIARGGRGLSQFVVSFQFNKELIFDTKQFYDIEFNFLINNDVCDQEDLKLLVFLKDLELFEQILYTSDDEEVLVKNKWNGFSTCFRVFRENYQLMINANSSCSINNNQAFIAVDNINIREKFGENLEDICTDRTFTTQETELTTEETEVSTEETELTTQHTVLTTEETKPTTQETEVTTTEVPLTTGNQIECKFKNRKNSYKDGN